MMSIVSTLVYRVALCKTNTNTLYLTKTKRTSKTKYVAFPAFHWAKLRAEYYLLCTRDNLGRVMRRPAFCVCKNKDADQLRGNREADQRFCFRYTDSTIPLLPKSKFSSLYPFSVAAQPGLCQTWSETPKTGFLTTRLI